MGNGRKWRMIEEAELSMGNGRKWRMIEEAELSKIQMIGIELGLVVHLFDMRS